MKRSTFLKLAFVIAAMFTFAEMNAQILVDYQNVAENVYQTAGKTFRVYVMPDMAYNPSYVAATGLGIDAAARWTWTYPVGLVTGTPASGTPANQNYVEFVAPTVGGPYTLSVVESTTLGIGCADASAETRDFYIVAAPTATLTTADPAQACGDQPLMAVALTFTEAVPVAFAGYAFAVNELVENIDPSDVLIGAALVDNDAFIDFPTTGKLVTPALTGAASPYGYSFNTSALTVQNNLRTRYTYTLIKASDAGVAEPNGVISGISEKSDYVDASINTHAFDANNSIVIIVNPTPTTGPIFHIPNNFAL